MTTIDLHQGRAGSPRAQSTVDDGPVGTFTSAFDDLYGRAYRAAFRLLGQREDAADVAQEALARAYSRWHELETTLHSRAWVVRVAGNLAIDAWRRRQTVRRHTRAVRPEVADPCGVERVELLRALGRLSRRQRDVVLLRYVADLPVEAVARALRCSTASVKAHSYRGLAVLRDALSEGADG